MKVLQVNTVCGQGSTGKIAVGIANKVEQFGGDAAIAYGQGKTVYEPSYFIGRTWEKKLHALLFYRIFGSQGTGSQLATRHLLHFIDSYNPDIIHLHNLHGNYLNYPMLFRYLSEKALPVVWTLHDCWSFTGLCYYFDAVGCDKWKNGCGHCPQFKEASKYQFIDNSARNFERKRECFTSLGEKLVLVPVSEWMAGLLKDSFFKDTHIQVIHNGINIDIFKPRSSQDEIKSKLGIEGKTMLLDVVNNWETRKGLNDILELRRLVGKDYAIVLVGKLPNNIDSLPEGIVHIERTRNQEELSELYSAADVFINPTHEDNFPTTNIESLACGTPVVTYDTGGSAESIDDSGEYGLVTPENTPTALRDAIFSCIKNHPKEFYQEQCRRRSVANFNENTQFEEYIRLYNALLAPRSNNK